MADKPVTFGFRNVTPAEKQALVGAAFDIVAPTYDWANRVFSLGLDAYWRCVGIRHLGLKPGNMVLDVCGGTGALAKAVARRVGRDGMVVDFDLNWTMLSAGRGNRAATQQEDEKGRVRRNVRTLEPHESGAVRWVRGNAENLPFPSASFDAVTVGFGLRNIVHLDRAFAEAARVLRPGGTFMAVEFGMPRYRFLRRLYDFYAFQVIPFAARLLFSDGRPYSYLAESVRVFQPPERTVEMLRAAGLASARFRRLTAGIAVVFLARKPQ